MGKVVGAHGIRGEIRIYPYGVCEGKSWKRLYLQKGTSSMTYDILGIRPHPAKRGHKGFLLILLKDCSTRKQAQGWIGADVFVDKKDLPNLPEGEYYHFELKGLEVVTEGGQPLGVIEGVFSTGGNDVYVVRGPSGEILVPAIEDVVIKVEKGKRVVIRPIEGLLPE